MLDKVKNFDWIKNWFGSKESQEDHVKRMAENRKPCSCWMCGNPRQHQKDKLTMQEKRAKEAQRYEIETIND